jgi:hypothetical protein
MKTIQILCVSIYICLLSACNNGKNEAHNKTAVIGELAEQTKSESPEASGSYMKATIEGKQWSASTVKTDDNASSNYKLVYGETAEFSISFYLHSPGTGDKRPFSEEFAAEFSTADNFFGGKKGELTITSSDDRWIEGKFYFTATSQRSAKVYEITDGVFRVPATQKK